MCNICLQTRVSSITSVPEFNLWKLKDLIQFPNLILKFWVQWDFSAFMTFHDMLNMLQDQALK